MKKKTDCNIYFVPFNLFYDETGIGGGDRR